MLLEVVVNVELVLLVDKDVLLVLDVIEIDVLLLVELNDDVRRIRRISHCLSSHRSQCRIARVCGRRYCY